ncbi:2-octaprenyl-3-methyl-6-methoxy-1,4-benzoquinol hydroxylase [Cellvibrio zantedeschiae]|uniref:2-octaprenyl-3-methyl-6-methoxy-1,4-benzoquinol hydroxylase n=1 Tax=Cellvibrio zantedeschiae TaxID=1237077 RepID=A0ABQ3B7R3_9GAMM|nr:FAD-dependent monooxygenase [Cellvibrio zantedeschiae]GGY83597.1 2-octaprenyl-3-methyl-6-methoxy-1,4-benzoquinol hydroxylase [Cellvibrio zantedeschiae]
MTTLTAQYDLIIVGAGLVGASLACAIAQQENASTLQIALIEASNEAQDFAGENFDPRVVALTQASQNLLNNLGVWEDVVQARACAYSDMHVWDGEGTAAIHFNCADVRANHLGHIVENSVVLNALRKKISQHQQIRVIQPARVAGLKNGSGVEVQLGDGSVLVAKLIIAADGAQSKVRELTEFETREWDYGHKAIITTVQTELPNQATAWQRFMRTGPLAFLPLPSINDKHFCSIVWSAETELAEELMQLNDAEFSKRLGVAFEHKLGKILHTAERHAIPLRQRHAKTYIQPHIVLVGDAAHNIHPLAGQGVNLGLLDVAALAQEIERALLRKIPLNDFSILRRYQRQRLASNLVMMSAMEAFKRLFGSNSLMLTWLRNTGMRQLDSITELKKIIVKAAMGIH